MIVPEVRTYIERASAARCALDALLDVLPLELLANRAGDGEWAIAEHVAHLATAEAPLLRLLDEAQSRTGPLALAPDGAQHFMAERATAIVSMAEEPLAGVRDRMREGRIQTVAAIAGLDPAALGRTLVLPFNDGWGRPSTIPLRSYLAAWAGHDTEHAAAIRRAASSPPTPAAFAIAARRRRP